MNLDELEKLAKAATPGKWNFTYTEPYEAKFIGPKGITVWLDDAPVHEFNSQVDNDANYIAAANPDTVLKLIRVARAAQIAMDGVSEDAATYAGEIQNMNPLGLYKALEDL